MNTERLKHLIKILERVESEQRPFDMGTWFEEADDCGTAACAFGWATRDKAFKAQGLSTTSGEPMFDTYYGFVAAVRFFGISRQAADYLFSPNDYVEDDEVLDDALITPRMVIEHVKEVLAGKFPE